MLDHDDLVGSLIDVLAELGIADNTIVVYTTENGPHMKASNVHRGHAGSSTMISAAPGYDWGL
jgi:arylsulfatase A-like enzyme